MADFSTVLSGLLTPTALIVGGIIFGVLVMLKKIKMSKKVGASIAIGAILIGFYMSGAFGGYTASIGTDTISGSVTGSSANKVAYPIKTLQVQAQDKYAQTWNSISGTLKVYESNVDPSDPNANAVVSLTLASGNATDISGLLQTDTPYRVAFDGGNTYYDRDFGVIEFASNDYLKEQGLYVFKFRDVLYVGGIDDPLDESTTGGDINGQSSTNLSLSTVEIGKHGGASDNDTLTYNESNGNGDYYLQPTIGVSGANKAVKDLVMCFTFSSDTPCEGNEYTSITAQQITGYAWNIPSEIVNVWKYQSCVKLGSEVKGGTTGEVKLTFTAQESNIDTNDDFKIVIDDLGSDRGKDLPFKSNTGASRQTISIDHES